MNRLWMLPAALAALLASSGCSQKAAASADVKIPERPVRVAPVGRGDVLEAVELVGELQGQEEVKIFSLVPERIRSLPVQEGSQVKANDLLVTLRGDLQSEGVNQAQAAVEAATASRDLLRDNLARVQKLVQAGSVARSQVEGLEAQLRAAEAQVRQASAGLAQASTQQGRTVLRSPIDGVVAQLNVRVGDLAAGGVPIMTVVKDDALKAVFRVPERDFLSMREGMKVTVSPLAAPQQLAAGRVTLKGKVVDRMTRTGLIEVALPNADRALLAGSAVRGVVELGRREQVVLVPAEAILLGADTERTGKAMAFVADGKVAHKRAVKVGVRQEGQLEITEGLAAGEKLVVQGAHLLRDGNPVRVIDDQPGAKNAPAEAGPAGEAAPTDEENG